MANAIKKISIQRGHDISGYALCCFGGAAGQHACLVADALGLRRILVHPLASVLSAYGMGLADERVIRQRAIEAELGDALMPAIRQTIEELGAEARAELWRQGLEAVRVTTAARIHIRYGGTDTPLEIPAGAVVVQGSRAVANDFGKSNGLSIYCPIIIKYRDEKTDASTKLEDYLR
jgi:5-oxoprolinase (ATP-hydrolysing)